MEGQVIPPEVIEVSGRLWDAKADFWDDLMGNEGNHFYRLLVGPSQLSLLQLSSADTVLEIGCGNGVSTRGVARSAKRVVACDVSAKLIDAAKRRAEAAGLTNIEFHVVDATDEEALGALGKEYDAALCSMALMDIPVLDPVMRALRAALKENGRFVFSICHPSFNHHGATMLEELVDHDGELVPSFSVKVAQYLDVPFGLGTGARDEPNPHYYFHRPLSGVLQAAFQAGFVLDGLLEPAFPKREPQRQSFSWANYHQIPPILVARLRTSF